MSRYPHNSDSMLIRKEGVASTFLIYNVVNKSVVYILYILFTVVFLQSLPQFLWESKYRKQQISITVQ
jgi:hypothetical protein